MPCKGWAQTRATGRSSEASVCSHILAGLEFLHPSTSQGSQEPAACDLEGNRVRPFSGILRNLAQSRADLLQPLAGQSWDDFMFALDTCRMGQSLSPYFRPMTSV